MTLTIDGVVDSNVTEEATLAEIVPTIMVETVIIETTEIETRDVSMNIRHVFPNST